MLRLDSTLLRPAREADLETLAAMRNDVALQRDLLSIPRGQSIEQVREWLRDATRTATRLLLVIANAEDDRTAGFIQLDGIDLVHARGELGIAVERTHAGQGHGRRAIRLLESHAAAALNLRKLVLHVLASNAPARHLYRTLGYADVGTLRGHFYHGGAHHDVAIMERFLRS